MNFLNIKAPEIFTKETDVELWLSRFKHYIRALGLQRREEETINILATLLDDECYRLVEAVGFTPNWDGNERTMLALFAKPTMNPHVYLQQFMRRTQRPDENVSQFAAALHDMAIKSLGQQTTRGGIDNFVKEQFILGLRDQQIADKLRYNVFNNLDDLINKAKDYEAMQSAYRGQPRYSAEPTFRDNRSSMPWNDSTWMHSGNTTSSTPSIPTPVKREPMNRYTVGDNTRNGAQYSNMGSMRDRYATHKSDTIQQPI